ncbi:hypothetical protein GCM10028807_52400 [Spirosoma daeguense]
MQDQQANRRWRTIEIPANDFNNRFNQFSKAQASTAALFSRLALIHQVAKAYATEAVGELENTSIDIEIDEITDPPLHGYTIDDNPVIIRFSY